MYENIGTGAPKYLDTSLDMKVTAVRANRIYNWLRELWIPKDLDWVPSVKAAPVRTGKLVTWIRDALVGVSFIL